MALEWTEELATSVDAIDEQHKEIFRRVNNLLDACATGEGRECVAGMLAFLEKYVVTHFYAEEANQRASAYPGYAGHKAQHDRFIADLQVLKRQFDEEGPTTTTVEQTNRMVVDWLVNHIKKSDREFGQYLRAKRTELSA